MNPPNTYTFGDTERAAARLRLLAEVYAPSSIAFLRRSARGLRAPRVFDLGCGPGYTTELLNEELAPCEVIGFDASPRYVAMAQERSSAALRFETHDVTRVPFPAHCGKADFMYARFLLTHLRSPAEAIAAWKTAGRERALLALEETRALRSEHPSFVEYYACVEKLQALHGQSMYIGTHLDEIARGPGVEILESEAVELALPAPAMAQLHAMNLATWRGDPQAQQTFDPRALDALGGALEAIATGEKTAPPVTSVMQQVCLRFS